MNGASPDAVDHLLVFRAKEPLSESEARAKVEALGESLVGDVEGVVTAWTDACIGTATLKAGADDSLTSHFDDAALIPISEGLELEDGELTHIVGPPPSLPAPPLTLKKRPLPVAAGVHIRLRFSAPLTDDERSVFDELQELFLAEYASPDGEHGEASAAHEGQVAELQLVGLSFPADDVIRGHAYWLIETLERFLPLDESEFVGRSGGRRGLRPSWFGPAAVMGAALGSFHWLEGADSVRGQSMALLFGPLIVTFLSRQFVGRLTWVAAIANALVQSAAAVALERPDFLMADDAHGDLLTHVEMMQSRFEYVLYGARFFVLVWAVPYVMGRRKKI